MFDDMMSSPASIKSIDKELSPTLSQIVEAPPKTPSIIEVKPAPIFLIEKKRSFNFAKKHCTLVKNLDYTKDLFYFE